jgi:formate dehydrogenase maturation protein FdhE
MSARPTDAAPTGGRDLAAWDLRIARARDLAAENPSATEILTFYGDLAAYQRSIGGRAVSERRELSETFADSIDLDRAADAVPDFLVWTQRMAPSELSRAVTAGCNLTRDDWVLLMHQALSGDDDGSGTLAAAAIRFVVEAVLQPFAEAFAIPRRDALQLKGLESRADTTRCPICGGAPLVGVLRESGHGAKRTLTCSLCVSEWDFPRVMCPACKEQRFEALPVYTSETFAHVRVEACDTCKRFLKTIDLTKNGLAVPIVDDLASVPLDLWAREQGYRRIRENLLRT